MKNKLQNQLLLIFLLSIQVAIPPHIKAMEGREGGEKKSRRDGSRATQEEISYQDRNRAAQNQNRNSGVIPKPSDRKTGTGTTTASFGGGGDATFEEGDDQNSDGFEAEDRLNEDPPNIERRVRQTSLNIEAIMAETKTPEIEREQSSHSWPFSSWLSNTQPTQSSFERIKIGQARHAIELYRAKIKSINSAEEEDTSLSLLREKRDQEITVAWRDIDKGLTGVYQRLDSYGTYGDSKKIVGARAKERLLRENLTSLLKSKMTVSNIELSLREKLEDLDLEELQTKEAPIFQGLAQATLLLHNNYKYINFLVERFDYVRTLGDESANHHIEAVKLFEPIVQGLVKSTDRLVSILKQKGYGMSMEAFTRLRKEVEKLSNALDVFYTDVMVPISLDENSEENLERRAAAVEKFGSIKDIIEGVLNDFDNYLDTLCPQQSTQRKTTTPLSRGGPPVGGGGGSDSFVSEESRLQRTESTETLLSSPLTLPVKQVADHASPPETRPTTPQPPQRGGAAQQTPQLPPPPQADQRPPTSFASGDTSQPAPTGTPTAPTQANRRTLTPVSSTTGSSSLTSSSDDPSAQKNE